MSNVVNVIWKKSDGEIPDKAKNIVDAAQGELLLKALQLPSDAEDMIRYNADKNSQSINDYISAIVLERLRTASLTKPYFM